ncbi:tRNA (adenosine(37)-N6)-threonylcarbamoyltransferase complex ATPase subunit type 1 TsaE [Portibacter marinus]|uniref:tRNA (adenosine(37)-N6)-threonylcarbamoyltransferase complex ATPase subunit type 1 TsaE n=1 Tax=Portibacter marinus TaxID=2898660 RepID=UPI001F01571E|nr:tRNA (adenosine(37)-N6)-threonylcarbamoyltransferase complex ATPase subunit type 1 TsaE [Portibacter marinus]
MEKEYTIRTLSELDSLSSIILSELGDKSIIILKGDLGTGKTTLAQKIVAAMGVADKVSSPTFSIVNEYSGPVYHFDLYRLKSIEELEEIGFFEYLDSGALCLIEWPELVVPYLDMPYLEINLSINEDNNRNVVVLSYGA